jgi:hypothetical protein
MQDTSLKNVARSGATEAACAVQTAICRCAKDMTGSLTRPKTQLRFGVPEPSDISLDLPGGSSPGRLRLPAFAHALGGLGVSWETET